MIEFRVPHYGIAGTDGCMVEDQIYLSMKSFNDSQIIGHVKDAKTLESVREAKIEVLYKGSRDSLWVAADSTGTFIFSPKHTVAAIFVEALWYRALFINFKGREIITEK
ncbi:MAG TPA: hypothetical protein VK559_11710 [Ferruginibacter sp.]|nr:hypothetical protein [Ferruginibacter sp.]